MVQGERYTVYDVRFKVLGVRFKAKKAKKGTQLIGSPRRFLPSLWGKDRMGGNSLALQ
jgi:hypothetical protein